MDLILIRHAQPDWAPGRRARRDPELTELGERQAALLAEHARRWDGVTELWASPLIRARQTAHPLAAALGLPLQELDWLAEIAGPPEWEGSPVDEIEAIYRESRARPVDEMWDGLPGGESFRAFHERVLRGLVDELASRSVRRVDGGAAHLWRVEDEARRVVIVAHAGTNAVLLGVLLGLEPVPWEWERFASRHASVAVLKTEPVAQARTFSMLSFGDVSHLPPELVTG